MINIHMQNNTTQTYLNSGIFTFLISEISKNDTVKMEISKTDMSVTFNAKTQD